MLSKATKLVLISGVHFNGKWEKAFVKKSGTFQDAQGVLTNVTMLSISGEFKFADLTELKAMAAAIPYAVSYLT